MFYYCTEIAQNETSGGDDEDEEETGVDNGQYVALMVVMPLFLICYGGSCIAYVVYKIYRSCSYQALHGKFVQLYAADHSSQTTVPMYPIPVAHEGWFSKKLHPSSSVYLNEPVMGAAAAVSILLVSHSPLTSFKVTGSSSDSSVGLPYILLTIANMQLTANYYLLYSCSQLRFAILKTF